MVQLGVFTKDDADNALLGDFMVHTLVTDTTIQASRAGRRLITYGAALAMTLAAPIAGADDGKYISITSTTAFAHTLTATGLLKTGTASVNVATFAASAGASLILMAYNGLWYVRSATGITFS
jgi:hypothetical protein